jgi:hypothetical protein
MISWNQMIHSYFVRGYKFILETRQDSGKHYPPKSLYAILSGLYQLTRANGVMHNFLDKKYPRFFDLHRTLDSLFNNLHAQGIGASMSFTQVMSVEDDNILLDKKIMSYDYPVCLQNMLFFYVGIHCCL